MGCVYFSNRTTAFATIAEPPFFFFLASQRNYQVGKLWAVLKTLGPVGESTIRPRATTRPEGGGCLCAGVNRPETCWIVFIQHRKFALACASTLFGSPAHFAHGQRSLGLILKLFVCVFLVTARTFLTEGHTSNYAAQCMLSMLCVVFLLFGGGGLNIFAQIQGQVLVGYTPFPSFSGRCLSSGLLSLLGRKISVGNFLWSCSKRKIRNAPLSTYEFIRNYLKLFSWHPLLSNPNL